MRDHLRKAAGTAVIRKHSNARLQLSFTMKYYLTLFIKFFFFKYIVYVNVHIDSIYVSLKNVQ